MHRICRDRVALLAGLVAAVVASPLVARAQESFQEVTKLRPSDSGGGFGCAVDVDDGTLVVGACSAGGDTFPGAVYVYVRQQDGSWLEQAALSAASPTNNATFGRSLDIDGDTVVVGDREGTASIFVRTADTWSLEQTFTNPGVEGLFGYEVALSGDTAMIGAPLGSGATGRVYVFTRSGGAWNQSQVLTASTESPGNNFGLGIGLDGETAIIGATFEDDRTGAAFVFTASGGTWSEQAILRASDGAAGDQFGFGVGLRGDRALLSALPASPSRVYVFDASGGTWSEQAILQASTESAREFGAGFDFEGELVIVGAPWDDENGRRSGAAFVFDRQGNAWIEREKVTSSDVQAEDRFGSAVAIEDGVAFVGAELDAPSGEGGPSGGGAVYELVSMGGGGDTDAGVTDAALDGGTAADAAATPDTGATADAAVAADAGPTLDAGGGGADPGDGDGCGCVRTRRDTDHHVAGLGLLLTAAALSRRRKDRGTRPRPSS